MILFYCGGEMTVYIEYVVINNVIVDYIILKVALLIGGYKPKIWRLLLCAFLGAIFSVLFTFLNINNVFLTVIKLLSGLLILGLSVKFRSARSFYIVSLFFLGLTFLMGGIIYGICLLCGVTFNSEIVVALCFIPVYLAGKGVYNLIKYIYKNKNVQKNVYKCKMRVNNAVIEGFGFIDTGNGLYDGDRPVIICNKNLAKKFMFSNLQKIKKINVNTVSGKNYLMGIELESLEVYFQDKPNIFNNVTICVSKNVFNGYDLILHPAFSEVDNESYRKTEKVS